VDSLKALDLKRPIREADITGVWLGSGLSANGWAAVCPLMSANDVVDGAYSAASKCDRLVALKAYRNVEGDDGLMRTGWTGDRENPLMGQALLSAG